MMYVKVSVDYQKTLKDLRGIEKQQFPYAFSTAINDTAFGVMRYYRTLLPNILDRPTSFTINSMFVMKSTKRTLTAAVGFKEWAHKGTPAVKYLSHLQYGGQRKPKRSEVLLRQHGLIRDSQWLIPTEPYMNQYGNVKRPEVIKMLSALQSTLDPAARSKGIKAKQFFIPALRSQQHFGPHIYKRHGRKGMRMFMRTVDGVTYTPIMNYEELCNDYAEKVFPANLARAMEYAVSTAKSTP